MTCEERQKLINSYLGTAVHIEMDRPVGYVHKKENYTLVYPINYGYIPNVFGGDGEELDVYLLGVNEPVKEFTARIIGAACRKNDSEDKLIAAPFGMSFTKEEIARAVDFQEKWYDTQIITAESTAYPHFTVGEKENADYYHRPGAYLIPVNGDKVGLIGGSAGYCFVGGGKEKNEKDYDCLRREVIEEIGYSIEIDRYFGSAEHYKPDQPEIGFFHPVQNYYIGRLIEKVAEPTEINHNLEWVNPEDAIGHFFIEMQDKALAEYISEVTNENNPR